MQQLARANSVGIMVGLVLGKPLGVLLLCFIAVKCKLATRPAELNWQHLCDAGIIGGIGFTMSIFITDLGFAGNAEIENASKMAVLIASLVAGVAGYRWLFMVRKNEINGKR